MFGGYLRNIWAVKGQILQTKGAAVSDESTSWFLAVFGGGGGGGGWFKFKS